MTWLDAIDAYPAVALVFDANPVRELAASGILAECVEKLTFSRWNTGVGLGTTVDLADGRKVHSEPGRLVCKYEPPAKPTGDPQTLVFSEGLDALLSIHCDVLGGLDKKRAISASMLAFSASAFIEEASFPPGVRAYFDKAKVYPDPIKVEAEHFVRINEDDNSIEVASHRVLFDTENNPDRIAFFFIEWQERLKAGAKRQHDFRREYDLARDRAMVYLEDFAARGGSHG